MSNILLIMVAVFYHLMQTNPINIHYLTHYFLDQCGGCVSKIYVEQKPYILVES